MPTVTTRFALFRYLNQTAARWPTPSCLRGGLVMVWLATALFTFAIFFGVRGLRQGIQTIGRDSAPSIIAAQQIRTDLAAMHYLAARMLLADSKVGDSEAARQFDERRGAVTKAVLDAAMNITYGEDEKDPIRTLLDGLGQYQEQIAQARILHDESRPDAMLKKHRRADTIMHETLLPAGEALDRANFQHLTQEYNAQSRSAIWAMLWVVVTGLLLLGVLAGLQLYLFQRMRRVINPGLALASVVGLIGLIVTCAAFLREAALLKRAKEDAFDSVHALMQGNAEAQDAQGDTLRWLLDEEQQDAYGKAFEVKAAKLVQLPPNLDSKELLATLEHGGRPPAELKGYLAEELRNITFTGEGAAARAALAAYLDALANDRKVLSLVKHNQRSLAVQTALGSEKTDCPAVFQRFEESLQQTLQINLNEFNLAVNDGFAVLDGFQVGCVVVGLGVAVLAFLGVWPRLAEYSGG